MTSRLPRIGFLGCINAMPMGYALKFLRDGHDVRFVVESASDDLLMRPEHQYANEVRYPYPSWIREIRWKNDLLEYATLPWSNREAVAAMADRDVVILNDYGFALAPSMPKGALCVALSSGADLDILCRWDMARRFAAGVRRKWLYPLRLGLELWRTHLQRRGLASCEIVSYFPRGLNPAGDGVIDERLRSAHPPQLIERYDANFEALGVRRVPIPRRPLRRILAPVRFNMTPQEGGEVEYKGNDLILQALARYRQRNPAVEIHFFEKGSPADLALARRMCRELGIEPAVTWHQPTSLPGLLAHYEDADVVFDQVGSHWMGGVGIYALYMGRPVIANARLEVFGRIWGPDIPILNATTPDEIVAHLVRCEDIAFRESVAEASHVFARDHLDTEDVYRRLRMAIMERWRSSELGGRR
jgi:glycosyltransferase involved in cell wall biosynthesis